MSTYRCRICGCKGYSAIQDWTGEEHITIGYQCDGCSVMFADPDKFYAKDRPAPPEGPDIVWRTDKL